MGQYNLGKILAGVIFLGFFLAVEGLLSLNGSDAARAAGQLALGSVMFVGGIAFTVYCAKYKRIQGKKKREAIKARRGRGKRQVSVQGASRKPVRK